MRQRTFLTAVLIVTLAALPVPAMQGHDSHGSGGGHDMQADKSMDHAGMGGTFTHTASEGGLDAEFQVMSLESMNMKDPSGATHHVMLKLTGKGGNEPVTDAVGKVKVISPSKKETVIDLTNYSGTFAANFTAGEPGDYGIICLLKSGDKKFLFKFWYPHK